ncbi:hypothetical protein FQN57_004084 [Myotisia sp. PD_48]|nr:hypothetical protein FQN57_004084 [Myotisia sp. PD_48]
MSLPEAHFKPVSTAELSGSCLSLLASLFVITTFVGSNKFKTPINRLIFYAAWGNIMANIAALVSSTTFTSDENGSLCQWQAMFIQWFVPADALWTLCMAFNVYLTLFQHYDAADLKKLEWKYWIFCYGIPFVPALVFLCVSTKSKGKIYGHARNLLLTPVEIIEALVLGFRKISLDPSRMPLRPRLVEHSPHVYDLWLSNPFGRAQSPVANTRSHVPSITQPCGSNDPEQDEERETRARMRRSSLGSINGVNDLERSVSFRSESESPSHSRERPAHHSMPRRASIERQNAAWAYTKYAMLFFVSLIVTWTPSSAFRVWMLSHDDDPPLALSVTAALVITLQGFWNSFIYIATSTAAVTSMARSIRENPPRPSNLVRFIKLHFSWRNITLPFRWLHETATQNLRKYMPR